MAGRFLAETNGFGSLGIESYAIKIGLISYVYIISPYVSLSKLFMVLLSLSNYCLLFCFCCYENHIIVGKKHRCRSFDADILGRDGFVEVSCM